MTSFPLTQSLLAAVLRRCGAMLSMVAMLVLLAWITGRIMSDRWMWSQWLLWIPTPVALLAGVTGALAALRPVRPGQLSNGRRRRLLTWLTMLVAISVYFLAIEHRFWRWRARSEAGSLSIVCWNMDHNYSGHVPQLLDAMVELDGDITVAIGGGGVPVQPEVYEGLGAARLPVVIGPFVVISRLEILEYRHLVASDGIAAAVVRLHAAESLGSDLTMFLVNLPSNPKRSRWELGTKLSQMLEAADAPQADIIVGDFNMTRNSRALRHQFPGFTHAFDAAGCGYGASFPRRFPLYHIDHVLLNSELRALSYELIDTGYTRHRAQRARVAAGRTTMN